MIVTFGNFAAFFLAALALIVREMYHYPKARRFLLRTLSITSIFTVLGGAEIEALINGSSLPAKKQKKDWSEEQIKKYFRDNAAAAGISAHRESR